MQIPLSMRSKNFQITKTQAAQNLDKFDVRTLDSNQTSGESNSNTRLS